MALIDVFFLTFKVFSDFIRFSEPIIAVLGNVVFLSQNKSNGSLGVGEV